jgi:hypothetical protein
MRMTCAPYCIAPYCIEVPADLCSATGQQWPNTVSEMESSNVVDFPLPGVYSISSRTAYYTRITNIGSHLDVTVIYSTQWGEHEWQKHWERVSSLGVTTLCGSGPLALICAT